MFEKRQIEMSSVGVRILAQSSNDVTKQCVISNVSYLLVDMSNILVYDKRLCSIHFLFQITKQGEHERISRKEAGG